MASLITTLAGISDPRTGNAPRHGVLDILVIALAASVCGAESCVDFAEFAEDREELLREFPGLENGLPGHDTFSRVFRPLDPQAFGQAFGAFLDDLGAGGDRPAGRPPGRQRDHRRSQPRERCSKHWRWTA